MVNETDNNLDKHLTLLPVEDQENGSLIDGSRQGHDSKLIFPDPTHASFFEPADVLNGTFEHGFGGKVADAVILFNVSGVANGGPVTQMRQVSSGIHELIGDREIPFHYVGPPVESSGHADSLTGNLPPHLESVRAEQDTPARYAASRDGIYSALRSLMAQGKKDIVIVTTGYTAYAPWATKEAVKQMESEGIASDLRVKVVIQDSSFPDTDNPSDEEIDGVPTDRFAPQAYASTDRVHVYMILNNSLPLNVREFPDRAPKGTICGAASFPFTEQYVARWLNGRRPGEEMISEEQRFAARQQLSENLEQRFGQTDEFQLLREVLRNPNILLMPMFASGGYYDRNNVGKWMTPAQYEDMHIGTRKLLEAVVETARSQQQTIVIPGVRGFVDLACELKVEGVYTEIPTENVTPAVIVAEVPPLPHSIYRLYQESSDIAFVRTTQANTDAELMLAGVPRLVMTMPANRYMESEFMDKYAKDAGCPQFTPDSDSEEIAAALKMLLDEEMRRLIVNLQDQQFFDVHNHPGRNFFSVVGKIAGLVQ